VVIILCMSLSMCERLVVILKMVVEIVSWWWCLFVGGVLLSFGLGWLFWSLKFLIVDGVLF